MLDAVATRALDRRGFALFVVNRSLDTAVDGRVALDLPADVTGSVTVLTGPSYDAKNGAQAPLRVSPVTSPFASHAGFSYTFPPYSLTVFRWTRP
jgi:alpha-L-arabinofuranosidase